MCATIAQTLQGLGMGHHGVNGAVVAVRIVVDREVDQLLTIAFQHRVVKLFHQRDALTLGLRRQRLLGRLFVVGLIAEAEQLGCDKVDVLHQQIGERRDGRTRT